MEADRRFLAGLGFLSLAAGQPIPSTVSPASASQLPAPRLKTRSGDNHDCQQRPGKWTLDIRSQQQLRSILFVKLDFDPRQLRTRSQQR